MTRYESSLINAKDFKRITLLRAVYDSVVAKDDFLRCFFLFVEKDLHHGEDGPEPTLSLALAFHFGRAECSRWPNPKEISPLPMDDVTAQTMALRTGCSDLRHHMVAMMIMAGRSQHWNRPSRKRQTRMEEGLVQAAWHISTTPQRKMLTARYLHVGKRCNIHSVGKMPIRKATQLALSRLSGIREIWIWRHTEIHDRPNQAVLVSAEAQVIDHTVDGCCADSYRISQKSDII